ncbi:MAG: type secretion exporter, partial [Verrucomicrobiales bacterium]|nr:type secretion exporter [Verrucomicrobiales bacterium]
MSEQGGEKTEQATSKKLEEAVKQGQFPRSAEVQTVFVLMGALMALKLTGLDIWNHLAFDFVSVLGHLHDIQISSPQMQGYLIQGALECGRCAGPVVFAVAGAALLAGTIQNRFQTASEVLTPKWERLDPVAGFKRVFSARSIAPTGLSILKLSTLIALSYGKVKEVLQDPIFFMGVDVARIAAFLAQASLSIAFRITLALAVIAAMDYGYQVWRTSQDLMMTKEEVKEEMKGNETNPQVKARQRRRRNGKTQRQMLQDVPKADVIVTNPTHLAIALRYDRKTMKAPRIIAKGSRLNALKIR